MATVSPIRSSRGERDRMLRTVSSRRVRSGGVAADDQEGDVVLGAALDQPEQVVAQLLGVEVVAALDHPDQPPPDRAHWRALAAELGLETTGASDCHGALYGYRLGSERTPDATVERLLARA